MNEHEELAKTASKLMKELCSFEMDSNEYIVETLGKIEDKIKIRKVWLYFILKLNKILENSNFNKIRFCAVIKNACIRFLGRLMEDIDKAKLFMLAYDSAVSNAFDQNENEFSSLVIEDTDEVHFDTYCNKMLETFDSINKNNILDLTKLYIELGWKIFNSDKYKWIFKKLTPEVYSTHAIICISGFTSENSNMIEQWKAIINSDLKWEVYSLTWSSIKMPTLSALYVFNMIKTFAKIGKCQRNAKETGKLLAFSLMTDFIFKHKTVSLIGFSMGTEVMVNWLDELARFNAFGIINNVYYIRHCLVSYEFWKFLIFENSWSSKISLNKTIHVKICVQTYC